MASRPTTVDDYLASLPADRRTAISAVRDVVNANLPSGYEEGMQYGMITWFVPLSTKPDTYNGQPLSIASLAAQKNHMAIYLLGVYGNKDVETWFRAAYAKAGKKLDMGKSCVRFTDLDSIPLDVIGEVITKVSPSALIAAHDAAHDGTRKPNASAKKASVKKASAKKPSAKQPAAKKPSPKKR